MTEKQRLQQKPLMTEKNICSAINSNGIDNAIGVPDFILARYLMRCLLNLEAVGVEFKDFLCMEGVKSYELKSQKKGKCKQ